MPSPGAANASRSRTGVNRSGSERSQREAQELADQMQPVMEELATLSAHKAAAKLNRRGITRPWSKPLKELRMATFNARAETVETKPVFRDAFKRSRCLIPISGYYEWQDTPGGKQPWYFTARDGSPLLTAAGLWDEWKDRATTERLKSCSMIIAQPNDFAAEIHDRMPVFLTDQQFAPWLSGEAGAEYLKPAPNDYLQRWPVSKRVNSSKADADDSDVDRADTTRSGLAVAAPQGRSPRAFQLPPKSAVLWGRVAFFHPQLRAGAQLEVGLCHTSTGRCGVHSNLRRRAHSDSKEKF
jgi:putative SOS response-associated peptidase YedK